MLTEAMKRILLKDIRHFLYSGMNDKCKKKIIGTTLNEVFKQKFYEYNLHNPLLHYLEKNGVSFIWLWKISLTDKWLPTMNRHNNYRLYTKPRLDNFKYIIKYNYSETTTLLFIAWLLEDVIKERIASDDLISKLSKKWAMNKWLGIQNSWRREMTKTIWCDGVLSRQDGEPKTICTGV